MLPRPQIVSFLCICIALFACQSEQRKSVSSVLHQVQRVPTELTTEGVKTPLNIQKINPSLSWHANVTTQSHFHIQVASNENALINGETDLWDSGKVKQRRSLHVTYEGKSLTKNQTAFWRVRVWEQGSETPGSWSDVAKWQMGLLNSEDWQAQWIQISKEIAVEESEQNLKWMRFAADLNNPTLKAAKRETQQLVLEQLKEQATAAMFRKDFVLSNKTLISARLHSTAAGYYEIYINGKKVDDRVMDPGQTDYDKRILYNTDDVLAMLKAGRNSISAHLGSGWYNEDIAFSRWRNPDKSNSSSARRSLAYGQPALIAQLELTFDDDSTMMIATDKSWLSHPSAVIKEGLFSGELIDANRMVSGWQHETTDLTAWQPVKVMSEWPTQHLEPQRLPPIKAIKELNPVDILNPEEGVWVLDFGQNFTGVPSINLSDLHLKPNQFFSLRYAEWIDVYGNISQKSGGGAPLLKQVDGYIAKGGDKGIWTPIFTWHGFRYVEIRGLNEKPPKYAFSAHLLRSSVEAAGTFESANALVNRIHDTALWGYESNLMALPMDCPIRERAGWTGDAHAAMITGNYNFNMNTFWQKYLGDFKTAKYTAPAVVPGKRTHGNTFDWAAAEIMIAWEHYRHHGNVQVLADQYESMTEYMSAAEGKLENSLLRIGYGDWCDPVVEPGIPRVNGRCSPQHTTPTQTSSALFAHTANLMSNIAEILNKPSEKEYYKRLFDTVSERFNEEFYDGQTGNYGSQTANSMAIMFDIAPDSEKAKVAKALNNDVLNQWNGHASVGALGQSYLYRSLSDYGYHETAYRIFTAEGYPGYQYLFDTLNATTLWERKGFYDPRKDPEGTSAPGFSLNHPFHSGYDGWFYEGLGGIRPKENTVGFQDFILQPSFIDELEFVKVSYKTGYGQIESHWHHEHDKIIWNFTVPANTSAKVELSSPYQSFNKTYLQGSYRLELKK
jgi:alpha-L-rhamnosidase